MHGHVAPSALTRRLQRRLGERYLLLVALFGAAQAMGIAVVSVVMVAAFYRPSLTAAAGVTLVGALSAGSTVLLSGLRGRPARRALRTWRATRHPTPKETVEAWHVAATLTWDVYRRNALWVNALGILPPAAAAAWWWDLGWPGLAALCLAGAIPGLYATVLGYSVGEWLMRPVVEEIAAALPDDFVLEPRGMSLRTRLRLVVPAYTTTAAVLVAGLLELGGEYDGAGPTSVRLALTVALALLVGVVLSKELTRLLGVAVTGPVDAVRAQLDLVEAGDYSARAPVLSADEIGALAHAFNRTARGLAERDRVRQEFGTYVDPAIAALILEGAVPGDGFEVEVSMLFCDVRGFTTYAETMPAADVVATLNAIFAEIVSVVEAWGGHVDKFVGDGVVAVFGAPESLVDHADRALSAAVMIVDSVAQGTTGLRVAAGVNTGTVVAGPIGGAGRLNFSVIGDAVNVAARVEAATRQTGDDVLVTAATRDRLVHRHPLVARGPLHLKGRSEPVEVFAPVVSVAGSESWPPTPPTQPSPAATPSPAPPPAR